MKRGFLTAAVCAGAALFGCDDEGPTGPLTPRLDFTISVPEEIPTKQTTDIEVRILDTRLIEYPLSIVFEKQNLDEAFVGAGQLILFNESERTATLLSVPIAEDPRFRVTITESSDRAFSVSQTTDRIDVLDFP